MTPRPPQNLPACQYIGSTGQPRPQLNRSRSPAQKLEASVKAALPEIDNGPLRTWTVLSETSIRPKETAS